MAAFIVPASFQHIYKDFATRVGVSVGMLDRIAHAGLGREVHHESKTMFRKQCCDRRTIREIGRHETELRMPSQDVQSRLLQGRIIVTVEIVEADNGAALGQQPAGDMKADKPCRTRDQYCSIRHRAPKGSVPQHHRSSFSLPGALRVPQYPVIPAIAISASKPYQGGPK